MKKTYKALLVTLCAVLLVAASVLGTLAYLTDSVSVRNTFTVGQIGLSLSETGMTDLDSGEGVVMGKAYKLLPGQTYSKDPTVTVDKGSEEAYIRMVVEVTNIDSLESALAGLDFFENLDAEAADEEVDLRLLLNDKYGEGAVSTWNYADWHFAGYSEKGSSAFYEFRYYVTVDASKAEEDVELKPLFTNITIPGEIDNDHLKELDAVNVNITAHAIQAAGFENADAAWTAFNAQHNG